MLIVLGALLVGGIVGSLVDIERRLESFGGWLRRRLTRSGSGEHERFIEGFVTASLVFCVGPLTILGSLSDGLGLGADQLLLKSALDGFAAVAFAASLGIGVMASAIAVAVVQGGLTLVGFLVGDVLPGPHLDAITATGGLLLLGVGLRLLRIKLVPVANLLPALIFAPLLVVLVASSGGVGGVGVSADVSEPRVLRAAISIGIYAGAFGLSFGAVAVGSGFSLAQTMVLSLVMFSGASQFAFVGVAAAAGIAVRGHPGRPPAGDAQRVLRRTGLGDPAAAGPGPAVDGPLRDRRDHGDGGGPADPAGPALRVLGHRAHPVHALAVAGPSSAPGWER